MDRHRAGRAAQIDADGDAKPPGLGQCATQHPQPFGAQIFDSHGRRRQQIVVIAPGVEHQHAADPLAFHFLQVARDRLLGDVAVDPPPIDPGLGRVGRRTERLFQVFASHVRLRRVGLRRHSNCVAGHQSPNAKNRENTRAYRGDPFGCCRAMVVNAGMAGPSFHKLVCAADDCLRLSVCLPFYLKNT